MDGERAPLRVLIVDDSEHFLEAARGLFEREGATVVGTASGRREALRLAEEARPDVVLVDVDLGIDSGFEVAAAMTAGGAPVVLISAYDEAEFGDLIAASPAVGFVPKTALSLRAVAEMLARRDRPGPRRPPG